MWPASPKPRLNLPWFGMLVMVVFTAAGAQAQSLSGPTLVRALRAGGFVIVMRHASSPRTPPDAASADTENPGHERQLDEAGRAAARAMGEAMRTLHIPIGQVLSSPTYRARQTTILAGLPAPTTFPELGEVAQGMAADAGAARTAWLRRKAAEVPRAGTDTVIVSHFPNIVSAFGQSASGLGDGEALILRPDGQGQTVLVARVKMEDWPGLAAPAG